MMEMLEWLGRKTLGIFNQLGAIILLFVAAVKQLPKISFHETAKQSLDLGVKSFSIVDSSFHRDGTFRTNGRCAY